MQASAHELPQQAIVPFVSTVHWNLQAGELHALLNAKAHKSAAIKPDGGGASELVAKHASRHRAVASTAADADAAIACRAMAQELKQQRDKSFSPRMNRELKSSKGRRYSTQSIK